MNKELIEQVKRHEGFRSKVYQCSAGKNTIGYGRNLDDVGITVEEAEDLLYSDLLNARIEVSSRIKPAKKLVGARFDVLVNMAFNLGISRLLLFKRMIAAIEKGDYEAASDEMLSSKWARQVGSRAVELSIQMQTGEY
jgi:lysozyme